MMVRLDVREMFLRIALGVGTVAGHTAELSALGSLSLDDIEDIFCILQESTSLRAQCDVSVFTSVGQWFTHFFGSGGNHYAQKFRGGSQKCIPR